MCGIAGIFTLQDRDTNSWIKAMAESLKHRGPDAQGLWVSNNKRLSLAHTRLSIIDVSDAGAQPMTSSSGRYTICFNGEIYNFRQLQDQLKSKQISLKGHSDTETLLELIEDVGPVDAIQKTRGMFAIALWDNAEEKLYLFRDRLGEKPLYYGIVNESLVFASELKAFHRIPGFDRSINPSALYLYLKYSYVPTPQSIYKGIHKLPAGSFVCGKQPKELFETTPSYYWDILKSPSEKRSNISLAQATSALEQKLTETISNELVSDVPIGAFLSGGVDSSLICALAQKTSNTQLKTFTIGYNESDYDESQHAKAVAKHLNCDHTEWILSPKDTKNLIPELCQIYDEPFADSSQLPTTLLSRMTRQHVTVALSGDGGDEVFGGYNRYIWTRKILEKVKYQPMWIRQLMAGGIQSIPPDWWTSTYNRLRKSNTTGVSEFGHKLYKVARLLKSHSTLQAYDSLIRTWDDPFQVLRDKEIFGTLQRQQLELENPVEQMMLYDAQNYLADDILVKVDRATMSTSLEARAPFLDHEVFELAWSIPLEHKIKDSQGKWILREILYKHVPKKLIERPKMGFGVPIAEWLRGDLKEWMCDLLSKKRIEEQGLFDAKTVHKYMDRHLKGNRNNQHQLWTLLMFQSWYDQWQGQK